MTTSALSAALVAKGPVTVALTNPHDPAAFYQTRAGLYVYRDFRDRIVQKATPTPSVPPIRLHRFVLERDAPDKDIEAELGPNHVFTETEVCWIVAEMIAKQQKGEPGDLLNNGYANLFYTPAWVVNVGWGAGGREWDVGTWRRVGHVWRAGPSAFSRN
jgi:hypothetical protein